MGRASGLPMAQKTKVRAKRARRWRKRGNCPTETGYLPLWEGNYESVLLVQMIRARARSSRPYLEVSPEAYSSLSARPASGGVLITCRSDQLRARRHSGRWSMFLSKRDRGVDTMCRRRLRLSQPTAANMRHHRSYLTLMALSAEYHPDAPRYDGVFISFGGGRRGVRWGQERRENHIRGRSSRPGQIWRTTR